MFIGAEPTYPSTGFGYLHRGESHNGDSDVYELKEFVEKPDINTARQYFSSGEFLWNMGYLVTSISVFERDAAQFATKLMERYQSLLDAKDVKLRRE